MCLLLHDAPELMKAVTYKVGSLQVKYRLRIVPGDYELILRQCGTQYAIL